jgi:hypothetical protein
VLRDIMFGNRRRIRELVAGSEEGIATNILASRLKHTRSPRRAPRCRYIERSFLT